MKWTGPLVVVFVIFGAIASSSVEAACPIPIPPWSCPQLPPPPPATNVRQLRPGNIKAIMALGDSITAGFAMIGYPPESLLEWREYGFATGGASGAFTLANIMQRYSPNIQGSSQWWTWPLTPGAYLNGAVSHASVQNTPSQVAYLVNQLQTTYASTVNFKEDWKLLTVFIGANNECGACGYSPESMPGFFEAQLRNTLNLVEQTLPRTFVQLVSLFNISGVWYAGQNDDYCRTVWWLFKKECGCVETGNKTDLDIMDLRSMQFNAIMVKLAAEFSSKNNPGFTVTVQPGLSGIPIAKYGESYLSSLDCFHPSLCANEAFTYAVWNNMWQPVGKKSTAPDPNNLKIICPTQSDYIQ